MLQVICWHSNPQRWWHLKVGSGEVLISWGWSPYEWDCCCLVAKLYLTLCDPIDHSLPGSSVHGISQAGILEWVAISFTWGSSWPKDGHHLSCIGRRTLRNLAASERSLASSTIWVYDKFCDLEESPYLTILAPWSQTSKWAQNYEKAMSIQSMVMYSSSLRGLRQWIFWFLAILHVLSFSTVCLGVDPFLLTLFGTLNALMSTSI